MILGTRTRAKNCGRGELKDAVHVTRGLLEFQADQTSRYTSPSWAVTRTCTRRRVKQTKSLEKRLKRRGKRQKPCRRRTKRSSEKSHKGRGGERDRRLSQLARTATAHCAGQPQLASTLPFQCGGSATLSDLRAIKPEPMLRGTKAFSLNLCLK